MSERTEMSEHYAANCHLLHVSAAFGQLHVDFTTHIAKNTDVEQMTICCIMCWYLCSLWHWVQTLINRPTGWRYQNCGNRREWQWMNLLFSVDKNQLDVTFCILYFSSNNCSTCFGQPCAHHQELTTAWCYSLVLVCAVAAGRLSRSVGR